jgi:hypothetical protein
MLSICGRFHNRILFSEENIFVDVCLGTQNAAITRIETDESQKISQLVNEIMPARHLS